LRKNNYMNTNEENPKGAPGDAQRVYKELDEINTRIFGQPQEGNNYVAEEVADMRIKHAEDFLDQSERDFFSKEEFDQAFQKVLQELDVAILTTNEPYARELRKTLIQKFG
jgi:hypothetical protein